MSFRAPTHAQPVLCDENRPDEIRSLLDALRTEKFVISMAFNAMPGYGRAVVQQPNIIMFDVELDQTDGFAVCRLLKADHATVAIPVIFLTGNGRLKDRLPGLREGAVDYILKPFEPEEVIARIYAHLRPRFMQTAHSETDKSDPSSELVDATDQSDQLLFVAATRHVQANLARMPPLAELARRVGTHERRFTRAF